MVNPPNKKGRLLYLLRYLYQETDENNAVSTNEIIHYLTKRDMPINRKTVKDDIDTLIHTGYDIVTMKSSAHSFFMGSREFELLELKLLIDAVSSSKFITTQKMKVSYPSSPP